MIGHLETRNVSNVGRAPRSPGRDKHPIGSLILWCWGINGGTKREQVGGMAEATIKNYAPPSGKWLSCLGVTWSVRGSMEQ